MKTQIFRIATFLLISLFYLTGCEKDNPAGGGEPILPPDFSDELAPAWFPDGSQIVYAGFNFNPDTGTLWLMNADGTNQRPLTTP